MSAPTTRRPVDTVSWTLRVASEWVMRLLLVGVGAYLLLRLLDQVRLVAFAFMVALLVASLLSPGVRALTRHRVPRPLAAAAMLTAGLTVIGLSGWFVVAQVSAHAATLADQVTTAADRAAHWLAAGPLHMSNASLDSTTEQLKVVLAHNQEKFASGAFSTVSVLFEAVSGLLLVIFVAFFLLRDGEKIWTAVTGRLPSAVRDDVAVAGTHGWATLTAYVRGVMIVAVVDAVSVTAVLLVLRVPLAVPLGVLVLVGAFVPLVGLTVTGAFAVLVTAMSHGPAAAVICAVILIVLVQVEGHVLHPMVMSRAVRLHPLAVVLAVSCGTLLAGIEGAVVAVPLVAFLNTAVASVRGPRNTAPDGSSASTAVTAASRSEGDAVPGPDEAAAV